MKRVIIYLAVFLLPVLYVYGQTGVIKSRYANGNKRAEISYVNDIYDGTSFWYYENGNLKEERTYSQGVINGWVRQYFTTGLLAEEYFVKEGIRDGIMKSYYDNGALKQVRNYDMGKLVKTVDVEYDANYVAPREAYRKGNNHIASKKENDLFISDAEVSPMPLGGLEEIQKNLIYPEHAKLYGLEGTVTILAVIADNGEPLSVKVVKGLGLGCDEAAIEAVKTTKFLPGQEKGNPIEAEVIFNLEFKIDSKASISYHVTYDKKKEIEIENELKEYLKKNQISDSSAGKERMVVTKNFDCKIEMCPKAKGGLNAIIENITFPANAIRSEIKGEVVISAIIDEYGFVKDTKILQGFGNGIDDAVEVAVLGSRFEPGMDNGEYVEAEVIIVIPIDTTK